MRRYLLYLFLFLNFWIFNSCKKDKLKSPKAAFLLVNSVSLKTNYNTQGSSSNKITDIWYYVDGQFKGVFPVGSVMPVVADGNAEITLFAGIKNNGISATRIPYPLYQSVTFSQNFEAGKTYTINPQFEYNSGAFFYYSDDFSSAGSFFLSVGDSAMVTSTDPSNAFEGAFACLGMSDAKPTAILQQSTPYFLPSGGATIYLELNYRCNQPFTVGVIGGNYTPSPEVRSALTVNTSNGWNKIYVQLTSVVSRQPVYGDYKVYIQANKLVENPYIYLDNVKLIYL